MKSSYRTLVLIAVLLTLTLVGSGPAARASGGRTPTPGAKTQVNGRTIYVSPSGDDGRSRVDAGEQPLASIGRAIRLAQPGDTIVVDGGTYVGPAGYGARPGQVHAPIRLQNAAGQRVVIKGTLQLENADYWRVSGINVTRNPADPRKEFLVKFDGGTGWQFLNAEVWGTTGVSNLMISGSVKDGSPENYRVSGDCIHGNRAVGDAFMNDHNIYLMPRYDSGPGLIEHNLLFDAANGAAIKAAGPTSATGASGVTIRRNTIARSAAGVIIGYGSNRIQIRDNLIGPQLKRPPAGARYVANYDAAVIGNHVRGTANEAVSNAIWGFPHSLHLTADSTRPIKDVLTRWVKPDFESASSCAGFHPTNPTAQHYGRFS